MDSFAYRAYTMPTPAQYSQLLECSSARVFGILQDASVCSADLPYRCLSGSHAHAIGVAILYRPSLCIVPSLPARRPVMFLDPRHLYVTSQGSSVAHSATAIQFKSPDLAFTAVLACAQPHYASNWIGRPRTMVESSSDISWPGKI